MPCETPIENTILHCINMAERRTIHIGHSPDPDDAFMFYGLTIGAVKISDFKISHVIEDIQSLNQRALKQELEVTAISAHTYPFVSDHYWIMSTGASMGKGYGPILVAKKLEHEIDWTKKKIAIPGKLTTAYLLARLFLGEFEAVEVPFDRIFAAVEQGAVSAGVIIHEGQLTYSRRGLKKIVDFGELWLKATNLPLPLGIDVVRSDLGETLAKEITDCLRKSIQYGFANESAAQKYALKFGRGIKPDQGENFVRMYVNDYTIDLGDQGRSALKELFDRGTRAHLLPPIADLKII